MAVTPKKLIDTQQLTNSTATYYTCPTGTVTQAGTLILFNNHTANVGVNLYLVPSGGSAGADTQIYDSGTNGIVLVPNETRKINIDQTLTAADTIQADASVTTVVTIRLSGVEFT